MDEQMKSIVSRIEKLEEAVFSSGGVKKHTASKDVSKTLADHIRELREQDFFKSAKTQKEVHERLQPVYECEAKRIGVELIRLHKKKELRKTSKVVDGKKLTAYVK